MGIVVALLVVCVIVLLVGVAALAWSDAPPQLKSLAWAFIAFGGLGIAITIVLLVLGIDN